MESLNLWVTIFIGIIMPVIGWLINTIVTKKIDDINKRHDEHVQTVFKVIDEIKKEYVRKELYEQAIKNIYEHNDDKYESLKGQLSELNIRIGSMQSFLNEKLSGK